MNHALTRLKAKVRNTRHHFRSANWSTLRQYEQQRSGRRRLPLGTLLKHSWRYGADFEENYMLGFFNKTPEEIRTYITRSIFFEFCEQANQHNKISITRDKQRFAEYFKDFLGRKVWTWADVLAMPDTETAPERLVVKRRWGGKGEQVYFLEPGVRQWSELHELLQEKFSPATDYVYEEHIVQHPVLAKLNPGSVNTIRVYTFVESDLKVSIWAMYLRVGNSFGLDSISQGGIGLSLNSQGYTCAPCVTQNPFTDLTGGIHPRSQQPLLGIQVPHFEAVKTMARQSALMLPEVRVIGWDIAIKSEGPCLIEGNDRGSHVAFQKIRAQGCRHLLNPHFKVDIYGP
jgi:hypothetical protein